MEQKPRVLVLAGPTASGGNTALSIGAAKALDCEIVCMDSMQIYRGMNIGTAKPTAEEMDEAYRITCWTWLIRGKASAWLAIRKWRSR